MRYMHAEDGFKLINCMYIFSVAGLQAIVDVFSNTLEETNLNGWRDLQEVK